MQPSPVQSSPTQSSVHGAASRSSLSHHLASKPTRVNTVKLRSLLHEPAVAQMNSNAAALRPQDRRNSVFLSNSMDDLRS
ncbi:hypothetical protein INR49_008370, partial [Caranx melampygus]